MSWLAAGVPAGLGAGIGFLAWAARGRASGVFAPSVWRGDPRRRALALTFDDGPSESTPEILRVLAAYGVKATFFECGENVRRLPSIAREVLAQGHEIGNHTDTHPRLWLKSAAWIRGEIERAQESIQAATGNGAGLFSRAIWRTMVRTARRAAAMRAARRDVDHHRPGLETARGHNLRAAPARRAEWSDFLFARRTRLGNPTGDGRDHRGPEERPTDSARQGLSF